MDHLSAFGEIALSAAATQCGLDPIESTPGLGPGSARSQHRERIWADQLLEGNQRSGVGLS
jgi:hypothetical protein